MYLVTQPQFGQIPSIIGVRPTYVLDRLKFDRIQLEPFHLPLIEKIAQQVVDSQGSPTPIRSIRLVGHTDTVGSDAYNFNLALRRAQEIRRQLIVAIEKRKPGLSSSVTITPESRGEKDPLPGSPDRSRRVEVFLPPTGIPPPPAPAAITKDFKIVVKSYIAPIRVRIGATVCSAVDPVATGRLAALALATDTAFSENPLTNLKDKKYRLYSERTFRVECLGGKIVRVTPSPMDTDVGLECLPRTSVCLHPPSLIVSGVSAAPSGPATFDFAWFAKGRPPRAAEAGFQVICPRISWFIWHRISGRIDCSGPTIRVTTRLVGSQFPSHRVFINGALVTTVPQGTFSRLWFPSPSDLTMVA
jgi:OmpA family